LPLKCFDRSVCSINTLSLVCSISSLSFGYILEGDEEENLASIHNFSICTEFN